MKLFFFRIIFVAVSQYISKHHNVTGDMSDPTFGLVILTNIMWPFANLSGPFLDQFSLMLPNDDFVEVTGCQILTLVVFKMKK